MRTLITCGPSFEPLDQVRRLTNFSTGELGARLATRLAGSGHQVLCLKGLHSTYPDPPSPVQVEHFTTNHSLDLILHRLADQPHSHPQIVFHVAALCDFQVGRIEDSAGQPHAEGKIPSHHSSLVVHLSPAPKLIASLPGLFPQASIVGWKYEVDGTEPEAIQRGFEQIHRHHLEASVVNGPAVNHQFLVCFGADRIERCADKSTLVEFLAQNFPQPEAPPAETISPLTDNNHDNHTSR